MIRLSIIIPVHNSEKYIKRCMDSILRSVKLSEDEFEIICVNDGSTDSSRELLAAYGLEYKNVKIIDEENQGAFLSRQKGVEVAQGEWIGFVDSDDEIKAGMYDLMLRTVDASSKIDVVVCAFEKVDLRSGKHISNQMCGYGNRVVDCVKNPKILGLLAGVNPAYWNKLFRKNLLKKSIKLNYSPKIMEDYIFWASIFTMARKVAFIKEPLYRYYENDGSATKLIGKKDLLEAEKALHDLNIFLEKNGAYKKSNERQQLVEATAVLHLGIAFCINYNDFEMGESNMSVWEETNRFLGIEFPKWRQNKYMTLSYVCRHPELGKLYVAFCLYKTRLWLLGIRMYQLICRWTGMNLKW